jgi:hypothetical protein
MQLVDEAFELTVVLDDDTPEDAQRAVADVFAHVDIRATVEPTYARKSAEVLPWVVHLSEPTLFFANAFAAAAVGAAGVDTWLGFSRGTWRGLQDGP